MRNSAVKSTAMARPTTTTVSTRTLLTSVCVGVCLFGIITSVHSGPVYERTRRMVANGDESVPVVSSSNGKSRNETSPNKDVCLMEGHTIPRRLVSCPTKPGCRAIQKEGECCPEYQCECERNGKLYENGEKIMDPETPCRVCYCQGGEFTCNNVTCYNRNDCKPKYTPGRCCPEYDNCPPLEITKSDHNENNSSDNTEEDQQERGTSISTDAPAKTTSQPPQPPPSAVGNDNPLGIKIKEITKPEEIRITDEKPKFKVSTTTTTTTTEASTTSSSPPSSSTDTATESTFDLSSTAAFDQFNKTDDPFQLGEEFEQDLVNGTDTNKNVREVDEGGFLNGLQDEENDENGEEVIEEEGESDEKQGAESAPTDTRSLQTAATEPVMEMEATEQQHQHQKDIKQVIIVDSFGASQPITVVGTSDLQFGGGSPDEDINTFDFLASSSTSSVSSAVTSSSTPIGNDAEMENDNEAGYSKDDMPVKSSTDETTAEGVTEEGSSSSTTPLGTSTGSESFSSTEPTVESSSASGEPQNSSISSEEEEGGGENEKILSSTSSESSSPATTTAVTDNAPLLDSDDLTNPEYPKLPEDLSQHQEEHVGNYADAEERSPGEPHLVPEWERNNGTGLVEGQGSSEEGEEEDQVDSNSVISYGEKDQHQAAMTTTERLRLDNEGSFSLDGDMMTENVTGEEEGRRSSPSPKDDVESLKMKEEEKEQQRGESKASLSMGRRQLTGEMSLWDLF